MKELDEIKYICEKYGYGQVMNVASDLWFKHMIDTDNPTSGVFVPVLLSDVVKRKKKYYEKSLPKLLTKPSELAKELGCSRQYIYRSPKFKKVKINRKIFIKLV